MSRHLSFFARQDLTSDVKSPFQKVIVFASQEEPAILHSDCLTTAADYEATGTSRTEELAVIAMAKKILEETSFGAVQQSYSFL